MPQWLQRFLISYILGRKTMRIAPARTLRTRVSDRTPARPLPGKYIGRAGAGVLLHFIHCVGCCGIVILF